MVDDPHGDIVDDHGITYRIWIFDRSWTIYLHLVLKSIVIWMEMVITGFLLTVIVTMLIPIAIGHSY